MSVISDDTDVLLLIPPDFFSVPSDSEDDGVVLSKHSERLLVSDLISQVNDLEGRICMIENRSIYTDTMPIDGNLLHLKHFGSLDTLNTSSYKSNYNSQSLHTTPLKNNILPSPCKSWRNGINFTPHKLSHENHEQHHNLLTSNDYVAQKEKDDETLKKVHDFFRYRDKSSTNQLMLKTHEKSMDKYMVEGDIEPLQFSSTVFNLNKVNELLKQLEETQEEIEQKLKLNPENKTQDDSFVLKFSEIKVKNEEKCIEKTKCDNPVFDTHIENKNPKRVLNFDNFPEKFSIEQTLEPDKIECIETKSKEAKLISENELACQGLDKEPDLISLCQLWGDNTNIDNSGKQEDMKTLKRKVEEEKYRRQHCEELIQKLQLRLLEEQQKVAVALKVDQEKDEALSKLTSGWKKLISQWKVIEGQRNNLEEKLQSEREKFENDVSAAYQTVKRYEVELSKALDLAHGYKEKCEMSEKEKKTVITSLKKEIEGLKKELEETSGKLEAEKKQTEKLAKSLEVKEDHLCQAKTKFVEMQTQIRELKKNVKEQQTSLDAVKTEKEKISEKLKEEKNYVAALEQSKKVLTSSNEEYKKKEKCFKENIKSMAEQMEKIKVELKEFYQDQVEKIVQEKLKEFQDQLSSAEKTLQKEIDERERTVTETAVKQVQQIVEKHIIEIKLMEEKHKEEIELWKIKVCRADEKVVELQKKLDHYSSHKTEIVQKLQNVMETQWQEALKIITASTPNQQQKVSKELVHILSTCLVVFVKISCKFVLYRY